MIDLSIVVVFVAYSIYVGLKARRQASTNLTEYFLAGRSVAGWRAGLSMTATQFAADTPLLVMGMLAVSGAASLWRLWIYGLAFLLMGFVLGSAWRRAGVLTDAELTVLRYSRRGALTLRILKAIYYGTVINCVVMALVLVAAVRIFELFLPWHQWLPADVYGTMLEVVASSGVQIASGVSGLAVEVATTNNLLSIFLMLVFVALYSTTGGLRSVISTDVLQLAFMLAGTLAYAFFAVRHVGGIGAMLTSLEALYGSDTERFLSFTPAGEAVTAFLVVVSLQWFFQVNSDGTGYLAQRTMACASERDARTASAVFAFTQIVVRSLLWLIIGLALLVVFPFGVQATYDEAFVAERELTFALGMEQLLPAGIRGLMLTAMLAALASTLDTHLNWGASYWSNDIYKGWWLEHVVRRAPRDRELVRVARLANVVLIALALWVMSWLDSIQTAWQLSLLFGAGMGAVLVLRWLWERVNLFCELAAIITSLIAAPILLYTVNAEWLRLAIMALVSTIAVSVAALWLPGTEAHKLQAFYSRVKPAGWWGRSAVLAGDEPSVPRRKLMRGGFAVLACACSLYGSLIGIAQILLQRAGPGSILLLVVAAMTTPYWLAYIRHAPGPGMGRLPGEA